MWICPKCNRSFKTIKQIHSCFPGDVSLHFKNKPQIILEIYSKLLDSVAQIGDVRTDVVKSAIFLKTSSTYLEIKPKKEYLLIAFYLDKVVDELPISKILQISKNRIVHIIHLGHPDDINNQLIDWLKYSYHLIKKPEDRSSD